MSRHLVGGLTVTVLVDGSGCNPIAVLSRFSVSLETFFLLAIIQSVPLLNPHLLANVAHDVFCFIAISAATVLSSTIIDPFVFACVFLDFTV